jgi:hypothetical protein
MLSNKHTVKCFKMEFKVKTMFSNILFRDNRYRHKLKVWDTDNTNR